MTLPSRHRIRNSNPGGLKSSTLPLGHGGSPQYWVLRVDGEETFFCFFQAAETGKRAPNSSVKGSGANLLRMVRWHRPPDTGFEIQTLDVWDRARYLSVTEAPNNTEFYEWMGKKHFFVSCKPPRPGNEPRTLAWRAAVLTSWGWWDDTALQTQDLKFKPWRSEIEHATSRSRRLPTILSFTSGWGRNIFLFLSSRRDRETNPEL